MYEYKATYIRNYDGDTITFLIDLGFNVFVEENIRLLGIDTPEIRGPEKEAAKEARDYVEKIMLNAKNITIKTKKDKKGKYGRYLGVVLYDGINLNEKLLREGFAAEYKG